jgi:hypothetical protein
MAYESTKVPVDRSQGDIRKLLRGHGAEGYRFGEVSEIGEIFASVEFVQGGHAVRMRVPYKRADVKELQQRARRARSKTFDDLMEEAQEQEARRIWRVLHWNLKARLEAVEEGLETFVEAFLPHLVNRATGRTVYEELSTEGRVELAEPLPRLALPGGEDRG